MKSMLGLTGFALVSALALAACSDDDAPTTTAQAGGSNGVCLPSTQIDHTEIVNDTAIVFYMKTGKPYLNTMSFPCPSLKNEDGFTFEADFSEICSNSQTIRVVRSGNYCELGQFTVYDAPKTAQATQPKS